MESTLHDFPLLTVLVLAPFCTALLISLIPSTRPELVKLTALLGSSAVGVLALWMLIEFDSNSGGMQFVSSHEWIERFGISWGLGVDGISLFLVVLTGLLFPLTIIGIPVERDEKSFYAWTMVLMGAVLGAFLATDLFLFFVMFELTLVPMYLLIGGWGHGNRVYAATKFFLFTMFGSAFLLVGMLALVLLTATETGGATFSIEALSQALTSADNPLTQVEGRLIFLAFAIAFAVKIPMFPVHTWLPDAHTEAPTAGSVILAGVLLKLGSYGLLRFGLSLFGAEMMWARNGLMVLGIVGITYGAVVAAMQTDLKRLVAYSSVAHMGFIVIGVASLTTEGLNGSVIQMVNHGVSTGALFLLVGMIYERRHTRQISELGGLQSAAPVMAALFTVVMLSSIGLPGLNGFVGEFLILQGTYLAGEWWAIAAASGVIFAALYLLWAYQRVFHGRAEGANATMTDIRPIEVAVLLPFLAAIVGFGIYPAPVLDRISPSVACALSDAAIRGDFVPDTSDAGAELDEARGTALREEFAEHEAGEEGDEAHGADPAHESSAESGSVEVATPNCSNMPAAEVVDLTDLELPEAEPSGSESSDSDPGAQTAPENEAAPSSEAES